MKRKGFTYLEVTVAMTLLSLAIVTASPLILRYHTYREGIFSRYKALYALEGEIAYLKSLPPEKRPVEGEGIFLGGEDCLVGIPEARGVILIEKTGTPGLSRAKVSLSWEYSGRRHDMSREILMRAGGRDGRR